MANIKKSFNFRNGVQVDDDNFIVNPNGLVGIGSTIPTESLDVQGNIRLRGTLYADDIETGSITNTSDTGAVTFNLVNVGITSIKSGIISASSGIVTYYGDGSNLQGLPTSQWIDVDPSLLGYTSIYSAGNVGVATTNPIYSFQVGGNFSIPSFENGVGISSEGDIRATRDITIGRNINIIGIATIGSNLVVSGSSNIGSNLVVSGSSNIGSNLSVTGITTSYSFSGFGTNITGINASNISNGTLSNDRLSTNINKPTGIATFNVFNGSLVGIATTARGLTNDANIDIISIVSDRSDLGIATVNTLDVTTSIGIGTEIPNSDVHLRKTSDATLEVTSDTNAAKIIIGREVDNGSLNSFGFFRFGNNDIGQNEESTEESFDIINYAPGNLNYYIRPESTDNLKFNWINYSTDTVLASLTASGKLGIGKTNPTETFEVVGTSTVTSNSFVGGDFKVSENILGGSLNISGSTTLKSTIIDGSVGIFTNSPNYTLQVGSTLSALGTSGTGVGISSSGNVVASGIITASMFTGKLVGIGSDITLLKPENISSGTITDVSINSSIGIITASSFVGNGYNLTSLNPSNISSGTIANVDINTTGIITASVFSGNILPENIQGGQIESIISFSDSVGIGTSNTGSLLQVGKHGFFTGIGTIDTDVSSGITTINSIDVPYQTSAEYFINLNLGSKLQTQKIIVMSDSVNAFSTEHSILLNSSKIASFSVEYFTDLSILDLRLTPEAGSTGILTYTFVRQDILI